jgi:hypothetical protein
MKTKKPTVRFNSRGESGNIFAILVLVEMELKANCEKEVEFTAVKERVTRSRSYAEALAVIRKKVNLIDLDGLY